MQAWQAICLHFMSNCGHTGGHCKKLWEKAERAMRAEWAPASSHHRFRAKTHCGLKGTRLHTCERVHARKSAP
uniref:Uncharacterized protein n=1 Tax=Anguilla anguilla TaxID=7936 RepID=A0A0E9UGI2_ANGAN